MGIVKKQTIQNSIIQYIGIAIGYFNSVYLFTNILDTEQYGLTRVIMAISVLYVNLSSLGAPKILIKYFPYFKTDDKEHHGIFTFAVTLCTVGFIFATLIYLSLKGFITTQYAETTSLFNDHYYYVILLSFLMVYSGILENFIIAKKETVLPYFLKSIFIRLVWILEITLYHYQWYDFDTFIFLYVSSHFVNFLIMLGYQVFKGEIKLTFKFWRKRKRVLKVLINYGFFSIVTGISNLLVNRIDIIMITFLIGLSSTSVYAIAYYISTVILVPSTAIYRISMPVVAEQWKNKNLKNMALLYEKSSINQLLIGGLVFLLIWTNIDDLFTYLKPEYAQGKNVVFILGMSVLFNMSMGINNIIVMITKYFRYDTFASIALGILTIVMNLLLIPNYGLEGAAFATLISVVAYQLYKFVLIIIKLKMQPFTIKTALAILIFGITYLISTKFPQFTDVIILRIIIKCLIISGLYLFMTYFMNISSDINDEIKKYLSLLGIRKSS